MTKKWCTVWAHDNNDEVINLEKIHQFVNYSLIFFFMYRVTYRTKMVYPLQPPAGIMKQCIDVVTPSIT